MYLTNLTIHGFKSFAKKTVLEFNGGLTCIVGPNGCGKSNIVDAVRWVLGEQRAGILRSEKMENVIFAGSESVKPLGMAEVSITIKNTHNVLPIEYSEVVITRRLYRSGESEYLLNKTPCRLKDIRDLLMDTGLGPDTYSVIELKMVESILNSKSEERLLLFEEAAGINKYKQRRNAAFRKLESTNEDLIRVQDILSEVEREANSLKRQVSRAERYQALNQEIEELEIKAAAMEYYGLQNRLSPLKQELNRLEQRVQQSKTILSREEADLEKKRTVLMQLEDTITSVQSRLGALTEKIHKKENEAIAARERLRATEEKITRYQNERGQLEKRIQMLQKRLEDGEPRLKLMKEKVDSLRMKYRLKDQELKEFEKVLARRRLEANEARTQLINILEELSEKEKERDRLEARISHLEGRKEQLENEIATTEASKRQSSTADKDSRKRLQELKNNLEKSEKRLVKLKGQFGEAQQKWESQKEIVNRERGRVNTLRQQKAFFENIIEMNEGYPDGVQFVLKISKSRPGVLGLLGDLIYVPRKYRLAAEAILGEKAFYVVVQTAEDAYRLIDELRAQRSGQVTFLILQRFRHFSGEIGEMPQHSDILARASDVIRCSDEIRPVVDALFGNCLFVTSADVLQNGTVSNHWTCATLSGEVVSIEGLMRSGRYEEGDQVGTISRRGHLEEILKELKQAEKDAAEAEKQLQVLQSQKEKLAADVESADQDVRAAREEYQKFQIEQAQRETATANLVSNLKNMQSELEKIKSSIDEAHQALQALAPEIGSLNRKKRRYEDETEAFQEKLENLETQRNQLAEEAHHLNVNLVQITGEQNSFEADLRRMRRTLEELQKTITLREQELQESEELIGQFTETIKKSEEDLLELRKQKDVLLAQLREQKQSQQELQQETARLENELKSARKSGESSADVLQQKRLEISEIELRILNLQQNIKEKYAAELTPIAPDNEQEPEKIKERVEWLKQRLRSFGAVNLMALDEYKKVSERLDFLYKQKNDLVEARDTLLETIEVINKSAREKFETVFEQIRKNFRENFSRFFDGGEGDLRIQFDRDDPLSAKIVILARPRGKQLTAIELLSAGEKALTAITLLFSIYQVKPSPFCILDEVDAPLDDISVRRFLKVLRDFSERTQFIIVTHNKLTMEAADYIYGVTMATEGVSRMVSVELNKAEEFAESHLNDTE